MSYLGLKPANQISTDTVGNGTVTPAKLTTGAPTWSPTGGVSLPRIDSSTEGGQLNFNRASDNTGNWVIDSYGSGSTPSLRFIDGANVRATIDGSGNVGIGTSSPSAKLHIAGNALISDGAGCTLYGNSTSGNYSKIEMFNPSNGNMTLTTTYSAGNMVFATNSTERMRIDSSGRVMMPYQPCFSVYIAGGTFAPNTDIAFPSVIVNNGSCYNTSNGRFTAPVTGNYKFSFNFLSPDNATDFDFRFTLNGTTSVGGYTGNQTGYKPGGSHVIFPMVAGDWVTCRSVISTKYLHSDPAHNVFSGFLIG